MAATPEKKIVGNSRTFLDGEAENGVWAMLGKCFIMVSCRPACGALFVIHAGTLPGVNTQLKQRVLPAAIAAGLRLAFA